jgi:hypothetical protein
MSALHTAPGTDLITNKNSPRREVLDARSAWATSRLPYLHALEVGVAPGYYISRLQREESPLTKSEA